MNTVFIFHKNIVIEIKFLSEPVNGRSNFFDLQSGYIVNEMFNMGSIIRACIGDTGKLRIGAPDLAVDLGILMKNI